LKAGVVRAVMTRPCLSFSATLLGALVIGTLGFCLGGMSIDTEAGAQRFSALRLPKAQAAPETFPVYACPCNNARMLAPVTTRETPLRTSPQGRVVASTLHQSAENPASRVKVAQSTIIVLRLRDGASSKT
jgi:hypothetical protein